jgi:aspartyl-tRNA(Asn)/glutamyl-tRNA(Gln) amidotransferase subunit A
VWRLGQALCHPAVSSALGKAADLLEGIGYQVIEVDLPSGDQIAHAFWQVLLAEARNEHQSFIAESLVEGPVADTLRSGKDLSSPVIEESWAALNRYSRSFEARCESVDLVLLPSSIGPAPRLADGLLETARGGRHWTDNAFDSMVFANILGWPALSVPVNVCDDLPIGLQLTGRRYSDYAVLKVGAEIDRELPSPVLRTVF